MLKFKKDYNKPVESAPSVDKTAFIKTSMEKLQARRGVVPAYNEPEKQKTDLNNQPIGGKRKTGRRLNRKKTRRSRK
jgi:hypothetical protein